MQKNKQESTSFKVYCTLKVAYIFKLGFLHIIIQHSFLFFTVCVTCKFVEGYDVCQREFHRQIVLNEREKNSRKYKFRQFEYNIVYTIAFDFIVAAFFFGFPHEQSGKWTMCNRVRRGARNARKQRKWLSIFPPFKKELGSSHMKRNLLGDSPISFPYV